VGYDDDSASAILTGLTTALFPAQSVPVTFTFASGIQISVQLPVRLPTIDGKAPTLPVSPSAAG
jgi:hypothetical protein